MSSRWIRLGASALVGLGVLTLASPLPAQQTKAATKPKERPKFKDLSVTPAAAPSPTFRYRLLPSTARLRPGDAAPIYLRLRYDLPDDDWETIQTKAPEWLDAPEKDFPVQEVKTKLALFDERLDLLGIAARRSRCDWGYPLDEQRTNAIELRLHDVNTLRGWSRILTLRARVEIAEGRFDDAIKTIEAGLAFGKHVGNGPFMINTLVGMAIEVPILNCLEDWIAKPGSPNLYWALTALPQPLVSLREAYEQERLLPENMIPELTDLDVPRSRAAWTLHFDSLYGHLTQLARRLFPDGPNAPKVDGRTHAELLRTLVGPDAEAFKQAHLDTFRKLLVESGGRSEEHLKAMGDDEIASRGLGLGYQILWDELFKVAYVPYSEARKLEASQEKLFVEAKRGPFALFAMLFPGLVSARPAEVRLDRRVAMLRIVEAVRIYAAGHDGKLPESLDAVKEVPIPLDPVTGEPFTLKIEGDVATLVPPNAPLMFLPDYRISIRKPEASPEPSR